MDGHWSDEYTLALLTDTDLKVFKEILTSFTFQKFWKKSAFFTFVGLNEISDTPTAFLSH